MNITKAVIPAAGLGTRMLPAAKAVPKELLPVLDRPAIQYVVEEAAAAGVSDVVLVTSRLKPALLEHFRHHETLEKRLKSGGKAGLLASLDALIDKLRIDTVYQDQQLGLGHAVLQARDAVGNETFLCMLGDTIFSGEPLPAAQLVNAARQLGTSVIGLEAVLPEKVERYGIIGGSEIQPGVWKIDSLVEKPSRESAPSRLAIAARYVLTPAIFDCLSQIPAGKNGEIQLTDALKMLLEREPIHGVVLGATRHDIGNLIDWLKTNLIFAKRDDAMWKQIEPLLRAMISE